MTTSTILYLARTHSQGVMVISLRLGGKGVLTFEPCSRRHPTCSDSQLRSALTILAMKHLCFASCMATAERELALAAKGLAHVTPGLQSSITPLLLLQCYYTVLLLILVDTELPHCSSVSGGWLASQHRHACVLQVTHQSCASSQPWVAGVCISPCPALPMEATSCCTALHCKIDGPACLLTC